VGEIAMARLYRGGSFPSHGIDNWFADITRSGGVFVDLSIHDFDFLRKRRFPSKVVSASPPKNRCALRNKNPLNATENHVVRQRSTVLQEAKSRSRNKFGMTR